jgi:hypothetical protein
VACSQASDSFPSLQASLFQQQISIYYARNFSILQGLRQEGQTAILHPVRIAYSILLPVK